MKSSDVSVDKQNKNVQVEVWEDSEDIEWDYFD